MAGVRKPVLLLLLLKALAGRWRQEVGGVDDLFGYTSVGASGAAAAYVVEHKLPLPGLCMRAHRRDV